jgi:hypothetical protein
VDSLKALDPERPIREADIDAAIAFSSARPQLRCSFNRQRVDARFIRSKRGVLYGHAPGRRIEYPLAIGLDEKTVRERAAMSSSVWYVSTVVLWACSTMAGGMTGARKGNFRESHVLRWDPKSKLHAYIQAEARYEEG